MTEARTIFRQVSLDRLASPEQLDVVVEVISPRAWLAWLPLGAIALAAALWSVFGSVETSVAGRGILLQRGGLSEVTAAAQGRITALDVAVGSRVAKGQTVAHVAQPELEERAHAARVRLAELQQKEARVEALIREGGDLTAASLAQQRDTLGHQLQATAERIHELEDRVAGQKMLLDRGVITRQTLVNSQNELTSARLEEEVERGRLGTLSLQGVEGQKERERELSQVRDEVGDAARAVDALAVSEAEQTRIESPYGGRVVEVRVAPGDLVSAGLPLITIEPDDHAADGLEAAIYLDPSDGKKVTPGMLVEIAPSTVRREEFGYLVGRVTFVSDYPSTLQSLRATLQNEDLAHELAGAAPPIEVRAELVRANNRSGYQWSSSTGPPHAVTAGTLATAEVIVHRDRPLALVIPTLSSD